MKAGRVEMQVEFENVDVAESHPRWERATRDLTDLERKRRRGGGMREGKQGQRRPRKGKYHSLNVNEAQGIKEQKLVSLATDMLCHYLSHEVHTYVHRFLKTEQNSETV